MRTLYFDCFAGASGNMILGALLALGIDLEELKRNLGFFYRNIEFFYRNIEFFYRNNEFFYKNIEFFYRNIGFFYKNIAFFYRKNDFFIVSVLFLRIFPLGCRAEPAVLYRKPPTNLAGGVTNLIDAVIGPKSNQLRTLNTDTRHRIHQRSRVCVQLFLFIQTG